MLEKKLYLAHMKLFYFVPTTFLFSFLFIFGERYDNFQRDNYTHASIFSSVLDKQEYNFFIKKKKNHPTIVHHSSFHQIMVNVVVV